MKYIRPYFTALIVLIFIFTNKEVFSQRSIKAKFVCAFRSSTGKPQFKENALELSIEKSPYESYVYFLVKKILQKTGDTANFIPFYSREVNDDIAYAFIRSGNRYIAYNYPIIAQWDSLHSEWSGIAILAHEIAHHLLGHTSPDKIFNYQKNKSGEIFLTKEDLAECRKRELEADERTGYILYLIGATLEQAKKPFSKDRDVTASTEENMDHPTTSKRLKAIEKGFNNAQKKLPKLNGKLIPKAEKFFALGYDDFMAGDKLKSVHNFTKTIEEDPANDEAYVYRASVKMRQIENYASALEDYNKAASINPENECAFLQRAFIQARVYNKNELALKDCDHVLKINNNCGYAHYLKGYLYSLDESKNSKASIEHFTKAADLDTLHIYPVYLFRAQEYFHVEDYHLAIEDYSKAIQYYLKSIRKDSSNSEIYFNRGICYYQLKEYSEAIKDFDIAIKLNSNDYSFFHYRGECKMMLKLVNWLEDDNNIEELYRGNKAMKIKMTDAIKDFEKARTIKPNNISTNNLLAYANFLEGSKKEALSMLEEAIRANPNNKESYFYRGILRLSMKQDKRACADLRKACDLGESNACMFLPYYCR